jgi:2-polyprenyl-3-methyl-5-hydroxy-6-metoxy-1,4-benzoquinol methylase
VGSLNPSYVGPREDILGLVPRGVRRVLDVGCSVGVLGEAIRRRDGARVWGIEFDDEMRAIAGEKLDRVWGGDVESLDLEILREAEGYDCICFADLLEHLRDPWRVLRGMAGLLAPGGVVVASIPNIRHYSTLTSLALAGYWPYRDRGIHDRTHLRFFTLRNVRELFAEAGMEIEIVRRNYRLIEAPSRFNRFSKWFAFPPFREFLAFQYLVRARRR